jgi:small-conductance mechanosensitive channel
MAQFTSKSSERLFMAAWAIMILPVLTGIGTFGVWLVVQGDWLMRGAVVNILFYLVCFIAAMTCMARRVAPLKRDAAAGIPTWRRQESFTGIVSLGPVTAILLLFLSHLWITAG